MPDSEFTLLESRLDAKITRLKRHLGIAVDCIGDPRCDQCGKFYFSRVSYKYQFKRCADHRGLTCRGGPKTYFS